MGHLQDLVMEQTKKKFAEQMHFTDKKREFFVDEVGNALGFRLERESGMVLEYDAEFQRYLQSDESLFSLLANVLNYTNKVPYVYEVYPYNGSPNWREIDIDTAMKKYEDMNCFYPMQLEQIRLGLEYGLSINQVDVYAKPEFDMYQMNEIRLGFEDGLSMEQVRAYADPDLDHTVMGVAHNLLKDGTSIEMVESVFSSDKTLSWNMLLEKVQEHRGSLALLCDWLGQNNIDIQNVHGNVGDHLSESREMLIELSSGERLFEFSIASGYQGVFSEKEIVNEMKKLQQRMPLVAQIGAAENKRLFNAEEYLQKQSTRELMALLDKARKCGGFYDVTDNHGDTSVTLEQIKAVLANREHVPNKAEAKKIRQKRAKERE